MSLVPKMTPYHKKLVEGWEERILLTILNMLLDIVCRVRDLNINYITILIGNKLILRVYETTIRLDVKCLVTSDNLCVKHRINLYCVVLNKFLARLVVTLRLDTLNLAKKLTKELTKTYEVIYCCRTDRS